MDNKVKLIIELKNKEPVDLIDLARSMLSVGDEYKRFIAKYELGYADADGVRLYIKQIHNGSIITELVALAPYALPFMEHANTVIDYSTHLKNVYEWFIGKSDKKPDDIEKTTLENLSTIIEPIAKDHASQINFGALNIQGDFVVNIHINSTEANAAQNAIRRELDSMKEPITGIHEGVVMYWVQARNQPDSSKAGDRAKIESIYRGDLKVRFPTHTLKTKMLYEEPYPFKKAFIVDVAVETINEKPALYKVLELHDIIDKEH